MSRFKNSDFFLRSRQHRTDDCMDAGDSATQEAKVENRRYPTLWVLRGLNEGVSRALTQIQGKQRIVVDCAKNHPTDEKSGPGVMVKYIGLILMRTAD